LVYKRQPIPHWLITSKKGIMLLNIKAIMVITKTTFVNDLLLIFLPNTFTYK